MESIYNTMIPGRSADEVMISAINNTARCNATDAAGSVDATYIIFYALIFLISLATLVGNGLIVHVYRTVKRARSPRNFFIFLVALTDLCIVPIIPLMSLTYLLRRSVGEHELLQVINYAVYITSLGASTLALFAMSFDRFLAIMSPLRHRRVALGERPVLMTAAVWLVALLVGFVVPLLWHQDYDPAACDSDWDLLHVIHLEYFKFILFPMFISLTLLMVAFYVAIFVKARRQRYWREELGSSCTSSPQETKMVVTAALVIGIFYVCWLPFIVVTGVQVWSERLRRDSLLVNLRVIFGVLPMINSAVNPVIYAFRLPVFKRGATSIICARRAQKAGEFSGTASSSSV